MRATLHSYSGEFSQSRALRDVFDRFPATVAHAEGIIHKRLGLPPLPDTVGVEVRLSDSPEYGCMPMCTPTGSAWNLTDRPMHCEVELSACAVAHDYYGYTSTSKVITHELVHVYFKVLGGQHYEQQPLWLKEGVALWTADQTYLRDFWKVPVDMRNERWAMYKTYLDQFNAARSRVGLQALIEQLLGRKL